MHLLAVAKLSSGKCSTHLPFIRHSPGLRNPLMDLPSILLFLMKSIFISHRESHKTGVMIPVLQQLKVNGEALIDLNML